MTDGRDPAREPGSSDGTRADDDQPAEPDTSNMLAESGAEVPRPDAPPGWDGRPGTVSPWPPPPVEPRPARGLFVGAWLLGFVGVALLTATGFAEARGAAPAGAPMRLVLTVGAFVALAAAFAVAALYQLRARSARPAERYRGPSPLILLVLIIIALSLVAGLLVASARLSLQAGSGGTFVAVALTTVGYLAGIWLFVVRPHVMDWRSMGWPTTAQALARAPADALTGIAVVVPAYFLVQLLAGLLAVLLGAQLPDVVPTPRSVPGAFETILAAAIIAPFGEEAFFRGFSMTAWWRDLGLRAALIRATLFFAAAHLVNVLGTGTGDLARTAILQFVVILPIGYVLGWLFARRGIVASMAGHMTFNAISVALLLAATSFRP